MTRRVLFVVAAAVACGPRPGGGTPAPSATRAAGLVVAVPDAATLNRIAVVLGPLGGERLDAMRIGVGAPWPTTAFADRGLDAGAPLGAAMTADGVIIRWAGVAARDRVAAAFDAVPGAARWRSGDAALWRLGEDAIAVIAGARAAVIAAGAPSTREQTALEIAGGALRIDTPAVAGAIALEIDGALLIDLFSADDPVPLLAALGDDLGRIRGTLAAAPDRVVVDIEVHPRPDTLADRALAGAHGVGGPIARAPFSLVTRLAPAEIAEVLTAFGKPVRLNAMYFLGRAKAGVSALTGQVSFGPGGVGVVFVDEYTAAYASAGSGAFLVAANGVVLGAKPGTTGGAGLNLPPEAIAPGPSRPIPPSVPALDDENTDVPWSQDYRDARAALDRARDEASVAETAHHHAWFAAVHEWANAFGPALAVPLERAGDGYRGHGEWRPPNGTIAATAAAATARLDRVAPLDDKLAASQAAATAARQRALEIRARDVAAWDRRPH